MRGREGNERIEWTQGKGADRKRERVNNEGMEQGSEGK